VNPLTIDACATDGTCRFEALPPREAVLEGLAVLSGLIEEAPDTAQPKVLEQLGASVTKARGQVTEAEAAREQFKKVARRMRQVVKTTKRAMRRQLLSCETALRLMDLGAGIERAARNAASPRGASLVGTAAGPAPTLANPVASEAAARPVRRPRVPPPATAPPRG
jgi:hypothetical protein